MTTGSWRSTESREEKIEKEKLNNSSSAGINIEISNICQGEEELDDDCEYVANGCNNGNCGLSEEECWFLSGGVVLELSLMEQSRNGGEGVEKVETGDFWDLSRSVGIESVGEGGDLGSLDDVKNEALEKVELMKLKMEDRVEEAVSSIEEELVELKEERVEEAVSSMKEELVNSEEGRVEEVVSLMREELKEDKVEETVSSMKEELVKVKEDRVDEEASSITEELEKLKEDRVNEAVSSMKEELVNFEEDRLEEAVSSMKEDMVNYDPVERMVLVSDEVIQFGEEVPIVKTAVSDLRELVQKEIEDKMVGSKIGEAISIEKTRLFDDLESVLEENENKTASLVEVSRVEAEEPKELDSVEGSQNQETAPLIRPMVQRTGWKSCCGLFEVVTGPIDD